MFNFVIRKTLMNAIISTANKYIDDFKNDIADNIDVLENADDGEAVFLDIRKSYLTDVANEIFAAFGKSASQNLRLTYTLLHPEKCGYEGIDFEKGMLAGSIFAVAYYVFTEKIAKPKDCIRLNHIHSAIMDKAISEIINNQS